MMDEEWVKELKERVKDERRKVDALENIASSLDSIDSRLTRLVEIAEDTFQLYESMIPLSRLELD